MTLTPDDVKSKQFTSTRFGRGYDEDEVDAFLEEVETELIRLLKENADLRQQVSAARAGAPATAEAPAAAPAAT
ncbi:MAG: hypothetical protein QOE64_2346, partial [Frankiales bacterium]|nr:hypothetical protein [Frankiales bacterium]